jgi:hypothetical protein
MPFNAETYRINRYRREARAQMERARDIKARAARGEAYNWEIPRIATFVGLARGSMRLARSIERGAGRRPESGARR